MKEHVGVLLWIYQQERPLNRLDYHAKLEIILKQNMKILLLDLFILFQLSLFIYDLASNRVSFTCRLGKL